MPGTTVFNRESLSWDSIDERFWDEEYRPSHDQMLPVRIRRIWPGTPAYEKVVDLRYEGLVDSGFIDPATMPREAMRLARDADSIVLGAFRSEECLGTLTLNTHTPRFPRMAMVLEKHVDIDHPYFDHPGVLEVAKLSMVRSSRASLCNLYLFEIATLIGWALGKPHLWQVSRDLPIDIRFRTRVGFDYSNNHVFRDAGLNGMPSRVGYMHFPTVLDNPMLAPVFRKAYRQVQSFRFPAGERAAM